MELKELEGLLNKTSTEIKDSIAKVTGDSDKAKAEVASLKMELTEIQKTIGAVGEQLKVLQQRQVPGLAGQEAKKFHFGAFCGALMREFHKNKGANGIGDPWAGAGPELEMCKEAFNARLRAATAADNYAEAGAAGGYLVPDEVTSEFVDAVIADTPFMDLGPTTIKGLIGDLPIPKKTQRSQAYMVGENSAPQNSQVKFGQVWLRPKKAGTFTKQSNRLIYQTRGTSDTIIRQDIQEALAIKLDDMLINGLGSQYQPLGAMNIVSPTAAIANLGSNGARARIDHAATMQQAIDLANEYKGGKTGNFGYLMHPAVKWGMKRERVTQWSGQANAAGFPVMMGNLLMTDALLEEQLGHKFATTTLVNNAQTVGTSTTCSTMMFGNWKLFYVGMWRDLIFKASDVASDGSGNSALLNDELFIVCFMEFDCQSMRDSAFTKLTGCETNQANWATAE